MITSDLFTNFQQRLTSVGGECHEAATLEEAAKIIAAHDALQTREIVVPPGFSNHHRWGAILPVLERKGIQIREAGRPADVADALAGLSGAELGVAETGSVMLADNALETRVVSMLTLTHFVLVSLADIVPMLDEVGARLQQFTQPGPEQRRYISLVTGPSRTADIERTLTIGVQGPKALCVLVVKEQGAA